MLNKSGLWGLIEGAHLTLQETAWLCSKTVPLPFHSLLNPECCQLLKRQPFSPGACSHVLISCLCVSLLVQFSSVQSLSRVQLFATLWIATCQASLSITNTRSLFKTMSVESVMPSNHLILCHPLLLLPPILPIIRVFSNELTLHIRWPKYWSFSLNISPSNEHPGLISFRMDWFIVYITVSLVVRAISLD